MNKDYIHEATKYTLKKEVRVTGSNIFTFSLQFLSHIFPSNYNNKLSKYEQLIGTTKITILRKSKTKNTLKCYKTPIITILLHGYATWTLTSSQTRKLYAVKMRLLRPLAGYQTK